LGCGLKERCILLATRLGDGKDARGIKRLIVPIAGVLLSLACVLVYMLFYAAHQMDRSAIERQQALADNALSVRLVQSLSELRSVAWWDEMVVKSRNADFDPDWLDVEVGVFVTTSYAHDRILILNEANQPVYGFGADKRLDTASQRHYAQLMAPLVAQVRGGKNVSPRIKDKSLTAETRENSRITDRTYGRGAAAILSDNGNPVLASIMSITPSIDMALNDDKPRLLVSIIDVNGKVLRDIGKSILMPDLSFSSPNDPRLGSYRLKTDQGLPIGRLGWTPKQPGVELIDQVLPLIAIVLLATGAAIAFLFKRLFGSTRALAEREIEARFLADHDGLTRLPNRRKLESLYEEHFADSDRNGAQLLMAVIDLDRFKDINDTLGHHAGDALIQSVAARIKSQLMPGDVLARLGGDEFAVLRPVPQASTIDKMSALILSCFKKPFGVVGHQIETGASVGMVFAERGVSFNEAIKRADIALYDAKAHGRGRSSRFNAEMARAIEERHAIEIDLKRAIAAKELTMNYQPIVEAATGTISSVEALVRWTSPTHGSISPDVFVSIAEECGMMADLGRFVINQSIKDARRWPELSTAINISPAQLRSSTIINDLVGPCRLYGVSPERITIEITESVLMASDDRTLRVLHDLKSKGFVLALDDFGTGYSSLSYIRDFPFDRLKIDRSFVKGLSVNDRALAIIKGVVNFGKILGREIVAEGIETEQEMQAMQAAGCTHLQGFLFSRALPADHIEAMAATFGRLSAKRPPRGKSSSRETSPVRLVQPPKRMAG
jgi:diguanylate cyclase (GGDEF)-like protein